MTKYFQHSLPQLFCLACLFFFLTSCDKESDKPSTKHAAGIGEQISWDLLPGWQDDKHAQAWPALRQSCKVMKVRHKEWVPICAAAAKILKPSDQQAKEFFESWFKPHKIFNDQGTTDGLITGYYEPILLGNLEKTKDYQYPLYKWPNDLLVIDLTALHPDLKGRRLRGRIVGKKVVPYYSRADIDKDPKQFKGNELVWIKDPVALFFLHIQGSGRVKLPNNDYISVGYDQQNGHPYIAIGSILIQKGEIKREDVSLQSIRAWLKANPKKTFDLLHTNPSYVFFRKLDKNLPGPLGALNLPLTPERSIAVDPRKITLGIPIWLSTNLPPKDQIKYKAKDKEKDKTKEDMTVENKTVIKNKPENKEAAKPKIEKFQRLMFAQDTGGAIRGAVRADVFWGNGKRAEFYAGYMKQRGELFALIPIQTNKQLTNKQDVSNAAK